MGYSDEGSFALRFPKDEASKDEDRVACQDKATYFIGAYPSDSKSAKATKKAFQRFLGPQQKAQHIYTDNSKEFKAVLDDLELDHDQSTPYTSEANAIAERAVQRVKDGTSPFIIPKWIQRQMVATSDDMLDIFTQRDRYKSQWQNCLRSQICSPVQRPKVPIRMPRHI